MLAKFSPAWRCSLSMIGLTGAYAVVLGLFGTPDWGPIYSGYLGLVLLAATLVSIGLHDLGTDRRTRSSPPSCRSASVRLLWTIDTLAALLPDPFESWLLSLSLLARFTPFAIGAMYLSDVGFFLTRHPARPVPDGPGAGAALSDARSTLRSRSQSRWFWPAGWLVAVAACCSAAGPAAAAADPARRAGAACSIMAGVVARGRRRVRARQRRRCILHDTHIDLTREKIYTPSAQAMAVVDELERPVSAHLLLPRAQDPERRSASRNMLEVMGRRNPLLNVRHGRSRQAAGARPRRGRARSYNAAIIEADGRRVLVQSTDEAEIAIGIQRVLRDAVDHGLLPRRPRRVPDGQLRVPHPPRGRRRPQPRRCVVAASSRRPATASAGCAGRWKRRATRRASSCWRRRPAVPADCTVLVAGQPAHHVPAGGERGARSLSARAAAALLAMFDLGFVPEPELARLLARPRRAAAAAGGRRSAEPLRRPMPRWWRSPATTRIRSRAPCR